MNIDGIDMVNASSLISLNHICKPKERDVAK